MPAVWLDPAIVKQLPVNAPIGCECLATRARTYLFLRPVWAVGLAVPGRIRAGGAIVLSGIDAHARGPEPVFRENQCSRPIRTAHEVDLKDVAPGELGASSQRFLARLTVCRRPGPGESAGYRAQCAWTDAAAAGNEDHLPDLEPRSSPPGMQVEYPMNRRSSVCYRCNLA